MSHTGYRSATALAADVRRGERSPVDLVDAFLDRIESHDDYTAFVTVCGERARRAAREAERALDADESVGPLHGVPVAVKDLARVSGVRTTYGSTAFADNVSEESDTVVDRLEAAGAVVVGKTNTSEFGRKTHTENPLFGPTLNPWDTDRTVGGSSGGSAAALAAGLAPVALGSDAAGSLRVPAAACGVCSLMPDVGRVPSDSRPNAFLETQPFTFVGPMARTVEDLALALDAMAGYAAHDPYSRRSAPSRYRDALDAAVGDARVAVSTDLGLGAVDPAVGDAVVDRVGRLADDVDGVESEAVRGPFDGIGERIHDALVTVLRTRYVGLHDALCESSGVDLLTADGVTDEVVSRIEAGLELGARDFQRANRVRTEAFDAVEAVFDDYDFLAAPTIRTPAWDRRDGPTVRGESVSRNHGWTLTWPFNLTGHPVLSVPAGTVDGLPVGLQLVAARGADASLLSVGAELQRLGEWTGWRPV
jgi:Asp-tRNA(Asn)/Glu-tRNA(Gln) amidotransferase A subunit family amidase